MNSPPETPRRGAPLRNAPLTGRLAFTGALVAAAILVVYAPVRHHPFVNFDDAQYVAQNPAVSAGLTRAGVAWAFSTGHAGNWHPLTWLSHMLDVELFGMDAGAHHLTSVVLHAIDAVLLLLLLQRATGALGRSAFVAALFALHPLHVESVAWVAERKDVLSALLFLLTLHAYVSYVRAPRPSRYVVVVALYALGLMAKPMLVTLPFVLLLLDYWPLGRASDPPARHRLAVEKGPLFLLAAAASVVTLLVQQRASAIKGLEAVPLGARMANAAVALVVYMGKMLWPARLAVLYPYPGVLEVWKAGLAATIVVVITAVAVHEAHRRPYLPVGWLWYLGTLVPVLGLVQVGSQPFADRYTYIPLIGLFIVVAWGVPDLVRRWPARRIALPSAAAALVLAGAMVTRAQLGHWRSSVELWEHAVAVTGPSYRAQGSLAHALTEAGRLDDAIAHYEEAVRLNPYYAEARNNLGYALAEEGRTAEAVTQYEEALRALPDYPEAHNNLGVALAREGRLEEAIRHLTVAVPSVREAAAARHNLAAAHNDLGVQRSREGREEDAIAHYAEAARLEPGLADAHANLGRGRAGQGRTEDALRELREALRLDPRDADLHYDVAVLLVRTGRAAEAVPHLERAVQLDPAHEAARRALATLAPPKR